jgi:heat shock protein HslJ
MRSATVHRRLAATLLAAGVLFAACGDDTEESTPEAAGTPAPEDLDGRTFLSTAVTGQTLIEGTQVAVSFEEGNVAVVAGCNTQFGAYAIEDDMLVMKVPASTMMMCDDESTAQDAWIAEMLGGPPTIGLDGDTLTLADDDITITLVDADGLDAQAGDALGLWSIDSLGDEDAPEGASLVVSEDTVSLATGCNRATGGYTVDGDTVTVGPLAATLMACEPLITWETNLLSFFANPLNFTVDDDTLTLSDGTTELSAHRAPSADTDSPAATTGY